MKKNVLLSLIALFLLTVPSFSAYLQTSYIANDSIMTKQVGLGKTMLSANFEIMSADQIGTINSWIKAQDVNFVMQVVPVRLAYGLSDNITFRVTVPWVHDILSQYSGGTIMGIGIGDIKVEALYTVAKETDTKPSFAINAGMKTASGTSLVQKKNNEMPTGTGNVDLSLSGIWQKTSGSVTLKGLAGYVLRAPLITSGTLYKPADNILLSCVAEIRSSEKLKYGAELWARLVPGQDYMKQGDSESMIEQSDVSTLSIAPYICYEYNKDVSLRGLLDVPLAGKVSASMVDIYPDTIFRGVNVSLGVSWTI